MRTESVLSRLTRSAQGVSLSVQGVSFNESGPSRLPQGVSSSSSPPVMRTESRLATALFAWDSGAAAANPRWRAEQETNKRAARMTIIAAKFHTGNLMIKAFRRGGGRRFFGFSFGYFTTGLGRRWNVDAPRLLIPVLMLLLTGGHGRTTSRQRDTGSST